MDNEVARFREIIARIFDEWVTWPAPENGWKLIPVMDTTNDHYLLQEMGWDKNKRVYGTLVHLDIIGGKVWIQHDQTPEGIADDLLNAGISKTQIVLGFKSQERRLITEFAVM